MGTRGRKTRVEGREVRNGLKFPLEFSASVRWPRDRQRLYLIPDLSNGPDTDRPDPRGNEPNPDGSLLDACNIRTTDPAIMGV